MSRTLPALTVLALAFAAPSAVADETRVKLDKAVEAYNRSLAKYREQVKAHFDEREEAARSKGDKRAVDQIKSERTAFDISGELPPAVVRPVRTQPAAALVALRSAFKEAVKEYTRTKQDAAATAAEKELAAIADAGGFPAIAGTWQETDKDKYIPVTITQTGNRFTATATYQHPQFGEVSWQVTGTVTHGGAVGSRLTHTKSPPGWGQQTRTGTLDPDRGVVTGRAAFPGGGHEFEWRRVARPGR